MPDPGPSSVQAARAVRIRELFAHAVELTPALRDAWLAEQTGSDAGVLADVNALLAADAMASGLFSGPGSPSAVLTDRSALDDQASVHTGLPVGAASDWRAGDRVAHYRLDGLLGEGGSGRVFRAWDLALARPAAIKLIRPDVGALAVARLLREVHASAQLQHPAIATFFEGGVADGVVYLSMELVPGTTLRRRLIAGPLAPAEALTTIHALLEALAHAHAAGLLHRDIKPENIMLTPGGQVRLLDFGIALPMRRSERGAAVAGTPGYMSPEQLRAEILTPASDVFQVGALLFELLTGHRAFGQGSALARMEATLAGPPSETLLSAVASPTLAAIVRRALAFSPADRYASAVDLLRAIEALIDPRLNATPGAAAASSSRPEDAATDRPADRTPGVAGENRASDVDALYRRAHELWSSGSRDAHRRVLAIIEEVLSVAPAFVPAWSLLAGVHATSFIASRDVADLHRATEAAHRALAIDEHCAEAWSWRAYALLRLHQVDAALESYDRAVQSGADAMASYLYGATLASL